MTVRTDFAILAALTALSMVAATIESIVTGNVSGVLASGMTVLIGATAGNAIGTRRAGNTDDSPTGG